MIQEKLRQVFWKVLSHAGQTWLEERSTIGMQIQVASSVLVRQHREEEEESDTNTNTCKYTNAQTHKCRELFRMGGAMLRLRPGEP